MVYLNNATTSFPKPESVLREIDRYMREIPQSGHRSAHSHAKHDAMRECRVKLAALLGAESESHIIFTSGSTEALNLAILGLDYPDGQNHVVTTVIEHNSVYRPLTHLQREGRISVSFVDCDGGGFVDPGDVAAAFTAQTRALVINHCSNVTGRIQDLDALGRLCRERGIVFIVDASQSAGDIPVDCRRWNVDLLAFTGHKSLFATTGIGGLVIRSGLQLRPLKFGGTGSSSELLFQPLEVPQLYEAGTQNMVGICALNAALDFIAATGLEAIHGRKLALLERLCGRLADLPVRLVGHDRPSALLNVVLDGLTPSETGYILDKSFGFVVRAGLHCAPLIHKALGSYPEGTIRVSPSYFNTEAEIDAFCAALAKVCTVGAPS